MRDGQLKILLAVDEASSMLAPTDEKLPPITYLSVFHQALARISQSCGFLSVFTDITPLEDMTSRPVSPSTSDYEYRTETYPGYGLELFPPLYNIPTLDLFSSRPNSWDRLIAPTRLFDYGCPSYGLYFKASIEMGPYTPATAIQETLRIATTKLLCTSTAYLEKLTESQIFALLGSVIQTRISSHSSLNSALVLKHAAHCIFIDQNQKMMLSEYPSQFVYASAANGFLASNETHWIESINTLTDAIQAEVVSLGNVGGMVTRIILTLAMQKTHERVGNETGNIPYGSSIELNSWIFNHFTRINYIPNQAHFMEFLYRGMAVECMSDQEGLDQLFTIYLTPSKFKSQKNLSLLNISFCGIRTQNDHSQVDCGDTVLTCLMNAAPEDVLQFLKSPDDHTVQWAKHVNPLFYGRHQPNLDRITNRQTSLHLVECIHTQNGTQTQLCRSTEIPHGDGDRREINLYFIRLVNSF
ncbi:hypothetical protein PSTT_11119 [Puccinia striiformis]|uniref:Uncharacterized protein n=1 Tax=Puccinia striiformis TaxID=27350 RepID=A0A2S4V1P1_9BASI|nr:hypothetical protein PSTT_11119 [Puccinia striiformis]